MTSLQLVSYSLIFSLILPDLSLILAHSNMVFDNKPYMYLVNIRAPKAREKTLLRKCLKYASAEGASDFLLKTLENST